MENRKQRKPSRPEKRSTYDEPRSKQEKPRKEPRPDQDEEEVERHWVDFATKDVKDTIHAELNMFCNGDEAWQALIVKGDYNVLTYVKGSFWSVHLMARESKDRFKKLMGNPGLKHFGLFLGLLKKDQFNLGLEGASELVKTGVVSRNWIALNDEGEKSFLYGNDIKKPQIASFARRGITHNRGIVLILNEQDECLGIGRLIAEDPFLKNVSEDEVLVKNVVDKGIFLRKQDAI